eukprot:484301-Pelagomonas_calceolata.AAC.2
MAAALKHAANAEANCPFEWGLKKDTAHVVEGRDEASMINYVSQAQSLKVRMTECPGGCRSKCKLMQLLAGNCELIHLAK